MLIYFILLIYFIREKPRNHVLVALHRCKLVKTYYKSRVFYNKIWKFFHFSSFFDQDFLCLASSNHVQINY